MKFLILLKYDRPTYLVTSDLDTLKNRLKFIAQDSSDYRRIIPINTLDETMLPLGTIRTIGKNEFGIISVVRVTR